MRYRVMPVRFNRLVLFAIEYLEVCWQGVVDVKVIVYGLFGKSQTIQTFFVKSASSIF